MNKMSIVVPVCNEEQSLGETIPALLELEQAGSECAIELVFVDDGSRDRSLEIVREYQARFPGKIVAVKLTRNFGSMAALQAGLAAASGDCVGAIAADLQDPPELLVEMQRHWRAGTKAVFAVRADREEGLAQRAFSATFYRAFRRFALKDYPPGGFDLMLLDRQVVDQVNALQEKNAHVMSLVFWLGYPYALIPYVRRKRRHGQSKWNASRKIKLFIDSFVAYSYAPIRVLSALGLVFAVGAFVYAIAVFYGWLTDATRVEGWTALMIFIAFTAGVQMTMLGILGEYLWRTLDEARARPNFVVDTVYR